MATFRHPLQSAGVSTKRLTGGFFGSMLACLAPSMSICRRTMRSARQGSSAMGEDELPGHGDDRICGVTFEWDLPAMIEKMLDAGFSDRSKAIARGCWSFSTAANGLARNC
jgi:hypothetical protein